MNKHNFYIILAYSLFLQNIFAVCPAGTAKADGTDGAQTSDCTHCKSGFFFDFSAEIVVGTTECKQCGTANQQQTTAKPFLEADKFTMCTYKCPKGTAKANDEDAKDDADKTSCTYCSRGYYTNAGSAFIDGQSECQKCANPLFQNQPGDLNMNERKGKTGTYYTMCKVTCPGGTVNSSGQDVAGSSTKNECTYCRLGYFFDSTAGQFTPGTSQCAKCEGAALNTAVLAATSASKAASCGRICPLGTGKKTSGADVDSIANNGDCQYCLGGYYFESNSVNYGTDSCIKCTNYDVSKNNQPLDMLKAKQDKACVAPAPVTPSTPPSAGGFGAQLSFYGSLVILFIQMLI